MDNNISSPEKTRSFTDRRINDDTISVSDSKSKSKSEAVTSDSSNHQTDILEPQENSNKTPKVDILIPQASDEIDLFIESLSDGKHDKSHPPEVPESVDKFVKLVESLIKKYESDKSITNFGLSCKDNDDDDDSPYVDTLKCISKLTKALGDFSSGSTTTSSSSSSSLNKTISVLNRVMSILEEEFRALLEDSKSTTIETKQSSFKSKNHESDRCILQPQPQPPEQTSSGEKDEQFPTYSTESVKNMNRIATAMVSSGYETECYEVYSIARRSAFKETLKKLGFDSISTQDVQKMQWESLERLIATWINVVKKSSVVMFPGERKFCNAVFSDYPSLSRSLFSNLARSVVIQLLNFAEAVATTQRAAEKLFKFLDMHEALRGLIPALDRMSSEDCLHELNSVTTTAVSRLGEATVSIFCELENSIKSDIGKQPVPSGAVHPLTRYTMNYLKYACDEYRQTLEHVFQNHRPEKSESWSSSDHCHNNHNDETVKHSPFAQQLMAVMDLLDLNLDSKSKMYKDTSLPYIFLMNNGRYILQKIKGSTEIHEMVGNTWCRKRSFDLRNYHKSYQRETWGRLLGCLGHEGIQVNGKVSKPALKERFKSFNAMFDEIHRTQSTWVVSDEQLLSELRVSISAVVIPAYRSFLGRFSQHLDGTRQAEKYIKYQPEDIETLVEELFDGNPMSSMTKKR